MAWRQQGYKTNLLFAYRVRKELFSVRKCEICQTHAQHQNEALLIAAITHWVAAIKHKHMTELFACSFTREKHLDDSFQVLHSLPSVLPASLTNCLIKDLCLRHFVSCDLCHWSLKPVAVVTNSMHIHPPSSKFLEHWFSLSSRSHPHLDSSMPKKKRMIASTEWSFPPSVYALHFGIELLPVPAK